MEQLYKCSDPSDEFVKVKHRGKIYTPDYLVYDILEQGHYINGNINKKHIIDNSCGDGQFLIQIVDRYCKDYLSKKNDLKELKNELEIFIHGIEIDGDELDVCIKRCDCVAKKYGIIGVKWDYINADTMTVSKFDEKMDFVVGNPPYVRVHNLKENFDIVKNFKFSNGGMTDLFITFYEMGINMLNDKGCLCYITPSSFFTSLAGANLRKYLVNENVLESVCDLKHFQPFNAITYTAIVCINKNNKNKEVKYYAFDDKKLKQVFVDNLNVSEYCINNNFYFSSKNNLSLLKKIIKNNKKCQAEIKNGFATLNDKVFINDFDFSSKYIIPIVKGSRAKWTRVIYPYDKNGKLYTEDILKQETKLYNYLIDKKADLLKRDNEKGDKYWYAFGRSQAINDTYTYKLSINALIKDVNDIKLVDVPAGCGVYSGLYILCNDENVDIIKKVLKNKEFGIYISLLGKYKSGGYYTYSSKDIKTYLDYKLGK